MLIQWIIAGSIVLFLCAILIRPVRRAIGLLLVILGCIECMSLIGLVIGIPSILVGGVLLFS